MATVTKFKTPFKKEYKGERGFPGPKGSGSSMTYPGAGIALSNGSAWDTPIPNNSANWNTAYGWGNWAANFGTTAGKIAQGNDSRIINGQTAYGWGNHALAGYAKSHNPSFTGSIDSSGVINVVSQNAGVKGYFTEAGSTIDENHENFILVGGYSSGYGRPTMVGHHYNSSGGYGFLRMYGAANDALRFDYYGNVDVLGSLKGVSLRTTNWTFEEVGNDLIIKRGSTAIARLTSTGVIEAASNIRGRVTL